MAVIYFYSFGLVPPGNSFKEVLKFQELVPSHHNILWKGTSHF